VKQSGGHVWLYSEPGHGTTVRIYLPRVDEARTREIPAPSRRARGRGETVLLVEDDDALRSLGKEILETNGYRVLVAGRGDDALALADGEAGPIQVLVTDVIMPGMPARELIRALRLRRPGLRVLCVSGYTDDAISRQGVLDAGLRLLPKPFTEAELTRAVEEVLGGPAEPPTGPSR
jgi:DNA-binding response OmpR family regulator